MWKIVGASKALVLYIYIYIYIHIDYVLCISNSDIMMINIGT